MAPTTINGGTLKLSGSGTIADSSGVTDDGTFDISGTSGASIKTLSGTGSVTLGAGLTLSRMPRPRSRGDRQLGRADADGQDRTLTGDNLYSGATTINGGTLALSGTGSISASSDVVDDATFDISATSGASIKTCRAPATSRWARNTLTLSECLDHIWRGDRRLPAG